MISTTTEVCITACLQAHDPEVEFGDVVSVFGLDATVNTIRKILKSGNPYKTQTLRSRVEREPELHALLFPAEIK
jgi:hypothetical protein